PPKSHPKAQKDAKTAVPVASRRHSHPRLFRARRGRETRAHGRSRPQLHALLSADQSLRLVVPEEGLSRRRQ
ncbi:hypothetical protein LTR16_012770, partial [Cryomyces antarcticus]